MKYYFSRREPRGKRILFVESGSRSIAETVVPILKTTWGGGYEFDLATCYGGTPNGLPPGGEVFRTGDYGTPELRDQLLRKLRSRDYAYIGIICSAEPLMTWWKWFLAFRLPAKVFIVNENADYFWLHRDDFSVLREFALVRMGMEGGGGLRVFARLCAFPFAILYLLLYALTAHARRALRKAF